MPWLVVGTKGWILAGFRRDCGLAANDGLLGCIRAFTVLLTFPAEEMATCGRAEPAEPHV